MSKKKQRDSGNEDDKQLELLEKENRELKILVRSLTKQLKKLSKGGGKAKRERVEELEDQFGEVEGDKCPQCSRGDLKELKVANRIIPYCSLDECGWRGKAIKDEQG